MTTLFEKMINREIEADIVYEDEDCFAINDINPQAPVHVLLIPKKPIPQLKDVELGDSALMGKLMVKASELAKELGLSEGFRLVVNNGSKACQSVFHLHIHILGGRQFHWPPG